LRGLAGWKVTGKPALRRGKGRVYWSSAV